MRIPPGDELSIRGAETSPRDIYMMIQSCIHKLNSTAGEQSPPMSLSLRGAFYATKQSPCIQRQIHFIHESYSSERARFLSPFFVPKHCSSGSIAISIHLVDFWSPYNEEPLEENCLSAPKELFLFARPTDRVCAEPTLSPNGTEGKHPLGGKQLSTASGSRQPEASSKGRGGDEIAEAHCCSQKYCEKGSAGAKLPHSLFRILLPSPISGRGKGWGIYNTLEVWIDSHGHDKLRHDQMINPPSSPRSAPCGRCFRRRPRRRQCPAIGAHGCQGYAALPLDIVPWAWGSRVSCGVAIPSSILGAHRVKSPIIPSFRCKIKYLLSEKE